MNGFRLAAANGSSRSSRDETHLTFSPFCISRHQLVDQRHVLKPLPLTVADDLWVAALVGAKQIQVEHHGSRPAGERQ